MKILLLGVGRWGTNHLRVLCSTGVELYVVDPDPERLKRARRSGLDDAHLSANYRDFADRVDGAIVVTPAPTHYDLCREFLEAGKDVFVEKPIAVRAKDARALARLAEANGRILQVGHIFRFDPAAQWLRSAVQEGAFGRVKMLRGKFSGFKRPRADSGVSFADAIHFVDLFNFLLGQPPGRVTAILKDFLGRGMDDESFIGLDYVTEHGPVWAAVESGYHWPGKLREVIVVGGELSAVCDFNMSQYKIKTYRNKHLRQGNEFTAEEGPVQQLEFPPEEPLQAELQAFFNSIQTRQAPLADAWAGYDSVRVLETALESARLERALELPPLSADR